MRKIFSTFLTCGIIGWCTEIIFTSLYSLKEKNLHLKGITSLWMFPIYGISCFLWPLYLIIKKIHWVYRGIIYMFTIFFVEYSSGNFLKKYNISPWNYEKERWNIHGLIRIDYAPFWFLFGLVMERFLINCFHNKKISDK
ncbi:MAG: putative ABC transporter permease [Lachnospiraceae bacterium]